ncbi:MAG: low molecular weight phosphatase family protein [Bifidobacterium sp.]|nr:low molecular weight phosphatase family protein [Bifidobacterium sp.]
MGELMFPLFFHDESIETDSAGTQGLINHEIDPSSGKLMAADGIDASRFRSKRITPQLANDSDLILCFTDHQKRQIANTSPRAARRTFTVTDFANVCEAMDNAGMVEGDTVAERAQSVISGASMVRHALPDAPDIADPFRKEFDMFQTAHDQMGEAFAKIAHVLEPAKGAHASA